jgi:hypothetical protein
MKTTMILPDQLLQKAKLHAQKNHMTMTRLMEDALRAYLATESRATPKKSWRIEPVGKGGFVSPDLEANWPKMRDLLYERKR